MSNSSFQKQLTKAFLNALAFLSFIFTVSNCSDHKISKSEFLNLDFKEFITISLNNNATNSWLYHQIFDLNNGSKYMVFQNPFPMNPNRLFLNSLEEKEKNIELIFDVEGPYGVGNVTDFYLHNFDSIFLVDRYSYLLSLVDSSGKVKISYRLKKSEGNKPDEVSSLPFTLKGRDIRLADGSIYIPTVPDIDPYQNAYKNKNLIVKVDLSDGKIEYLLGFPTSFGNEFLGGPDHFLPSITAFRNPNEFLISYPTSDSVYFFDAKNDVLRKMFISKSDFVENIKSPNPQNWEYEDRTRHQLETPRHALVIFDQFREKIYRISLGGFDDESVDKILKNSKVTPRKASLNVHDITGRLISTHVIDTRNYDPFDIIVLENGLYLGEDSNKSEDEKTFYKIAFD